jgi:hypothetical protein
MNLPASAGSDSDSEKVDGLNRSPSGSICPYYYMGGELHPLKYGSYFKDKEKGNVSELLLKRECFKLRVNDLLNQKSVNTQDCCFLTAG